MRYFISSTLLKLRLSGKLANLRRITFIPFVLSWFVRLPLILVVAYPIIMLFSFFYLRLKRGVPLTEELLNHDIGAFFVDNPPSSFFRRLWNIWHFRNYDEKKPLREKIYILILRIFVSAFYIFFFATIIRTIAIYFPIFNEILLRIKETIIEIISRFIPDF